MAKIGKKDVYRVTLDFSRSSQGHIEQLCEIIGASTKAELFKSALALFDFVVGHLKKGDSFFIEDGRGKIKEVAWTLLIEKKKKNKKRKPPL